MLKIAVDKVQTKSVVFTVITYKSNGFTFGTNICHVTSNPTCHLLTCYLFLNINMTKSVHLNKWQ